MDGSAGNTTMRLSADSHRVCPVFPTPILDAWRINANLIDRLVDFRLGIGDA
jgi:hypothetical protein